MKVNGIEIELQKQTTISDFLLQEGYIIENVAIEKNKTIIPKKDFENEMLNNTDSIEIVQFVGGG